MCAAIGCPNGAMGDTPFCAYHWNALSASGRQRFHDAVKSVDPHLRASSPIVLAATIRAVAELDRLYPNPPPSPEPGAGWNDEDEGDDDDDGPDDWEGNKRPPAP